MTAADGSVLAADLTIADAWKSAQASDLSVYLVGAPTHVLGAVLRSDLDKLHGTDRDADPIVTIAQESFVHAHPEHTMDIVLERLEESGGMLPVISRTDAHRVEGVITPESLTRRRRGPVERGAGAAPGRLVIPISFSIRFGLRWSPCSIDQSSRMKSRAGSSS